MFPNQKTQPPGAGRKSPKKKYDMGTQTYKPVLPPAAPSPDGGDAGGAPAPNPNAPLGQGGRFAALKQKLSGKPGINNPAGLAASIGRKKLGAAKFNSLSHGG